MTVNNSARVLTYTGDGSTTQFTSPTYIDPATILVEKLDSDGVATTQISGTHYTLSGARTEAGGTVTFLTVPTDYTPTAAETVRITRTVDLTQDTDLQSGGRYRAQAIEDGLDVVTFGLQQLNEISERSIKLPIDDTGTDATLGNATARADKVVGFDTNGNLTLLGGVEPSAAQRFTFTTITDEYDYTLTDVATSEAIDADSSTVIAVVGGAWVAQQGVEFTVSGSTLSFEPVGEFASGVLAGLPVHGWVFSALTTGEVKDGAITTAKLVDGAVTDAKIADVSGSKLTSSSVALSKLATQANQGVPVFLPTGVPSFLSGPATWGKRLTSNTDGTFTFEFSSFYRQRAVFRRTAASGTGGGGIASGRNDVLLNSTAVNTITGSSLNTSTGVMTLPAGTYFILATDMSYMSSNRRLWLYNTTDVTDVAELLGMPARTASADVTLANTLSGWFTLAATKALKLQLWSSQTDGGSSSHGRAVSDGSLELHSECMLWRIGQ